MSRPSPDELERLRMAFSSVDEVGEPDDHIVESDRIWQAVRGELSPADVEDLADQASRSPQTAAAWRLAAELSRELGGIGDERVVPISRRRHLRWAVGLAAAAVIMIGIGLPVFRSLAPKPMPTLRAAEGFEIASELPAEHPLPRDAFELRWTPVGEGSLYEIVLTNSELAILDRASFLESPRYVVPAGALADLTEGDEVWWKIDATRPDGSRVSSPTFVTAVK